MNIIQRLSAVAIAAMSFTSLANASVIYDWIPVQGSQGRVAETPSGYIEVSEDAVRRGALQWSFPYDVSSTDQGFDALPLQSSRFVFAFENGNMGVPTFGQRPFLQQQGSITLDLVFNPDGTLSGSLSQSGIYTGFDAMRVGDYWSIVDLGSDAIIGYQDPSVDRGTGRCVGTFIDNCGGLGQFRARRLPAEVPGPSNSGLFLLALGLTGAALTRRRSRA